MLPSHGCDCLCAAGDPDGDYDNDGTADQRLHGWTADTMTTVTVTCLPADGTYSGMGALLDADAMQDWMTAMHPLEHGGHTHGGPMMGGSPMMGRNTVPTGQHNLFMFSMGNANNAIMDALAR